MVAAFKCYDGKALGLTKLERAVVREMRKLERLLSTTNNTQEQV
jgi:hypothetical protein